MTYILKCNLNFKNSWLAVVVWIHRTKQNKMLKKIQGFVPPKKIYKKKKNFTGIFSWIPRTQSSLLTEFKVVGWKGNSVSSTLIDFDNSCIKSS
jgi:hypothetical protein